MLFAIVIGVVLLVSACFFLPWSKIRWGKMELSPARTITVVGEAEGQQKSQIAQFTAGVNAVGDNKEELISEVNKKIETLISSVKKFGIAEKDIKTQNLSVYQGEETYYDSEGRQKSRPSQWRVSNSLNIILREVTRASDLADLLGKSGANNVYGPNFSADDTQNMETGLLEQAVLNAQEKAVLAARAAGGNLGKIISITEGAVSSTGIFRMMEGGGGGGTPIEPGSSSVRKSATVVFEIE